MIFLVRQMNSSCRKCVDSCGMENSDYGKVINLFTTAKLAISKNNIASAGYSGIQYSGPCSACNHN
jgi:hypothetical protein